MSLPSSKRQAGVRIEITERMIESGVNVLRSWISDEHRFDGLDHQIVTEIFEKMLLSSEEESS